MAQNHGQPGKHQDQTKASSRQEHKELVKLLVNSLDVTTPSSQRRLSELRDLGKEIWQGVDTQTYVNQLRDEWDKQACTGNPRSTAGRIGTNN